ncbi:conjugal transfer protein TraF [Atlantibacter sp.]|uniref:conjugal transfer protein TraF n=1 Tax=Atlantibacter sp. TaxID=1903473 RepID=UPI0013EF8DF8|nr:conjugal transfer protein TraF [Atlantibacter sp.]
MTRRTTVKKIKLSAVAAAVSLLVANGASAANTWTEARGDAMGGTGVAAAHYGSGVLLNPALLAKAQPEDDVTVILPTVGAQISDKDNLADQIDDISDRINYYEDVIDNFGPEDLLNLNGSLQQFQNAAGELADQLQTLNGKVATARAGAGIAVSIPNDVLSVAFVAKGYAHARLSSWVDPDDISYLRGIQNSDIRAGAVALDASINGSERITNNLRSTGFGRAAIVSDYGVAFAKQFDIGDVPVSFGVTPKLQKTWLYNYTVPIYLYKSSEWNSTRYRNDDTGFNVDAGLAADFGENWTVAVSGQNLISRDIDTKVVNGYKDTYEIKPLVTAGVAWNTENVTLTADGDLTETKGFKSEEDSQYAGVGAEVRPLSWLALRAGYRADIKGNDNDVFTAGVGFAPFNRVHLDLTGLVGEKETWGAGAQLSVTF